MNKYIACERSKIVDRLIGREILTLANGLFEKLLNDSEYFIYDEIENFYYEDENEEYEPKEVYQWWIVSDYLYERLQEVGEVVCDVEGVYFWGRTACGIGLEYDYCFKKIATNIYNTGLKDSEKLEV